MKLPKLFSKLDLTKPKVLAKEKLKTRLRVLRTRVLHFRQAKLKSPKVRFVLAAIAKLRRAKMAISKRVRQAKMALEKRNKMSKGLTKQQKAANMYVKRAQLAVKGRRNKKRKGRCDKRYRKALKRVANKARATYKRIITPSKKQHSRHTYRPELPALRRLSAARTVPLAGRKFKLLLKRALSPATLHKVKLRKRLTGSKSYYVRMFNRDIRKQFLADEGNFLARHPTDARFGPVNKYSLRAIPYGDAE